ncbi:MAG TPA: pyridoxamine 5'-phosphate oxidase family protein [Desulfuromonadales bacterium]|nr:pyridoxamine 5'-phosphate oxidase family protein [Desulfuromonadales bacterium]
MLRNDQQITDPAAIEAVIGQAVVCRLAMCDGDRPYLVPLCFGYRNNTLFFHSAPDGQKIRLLRRNNRVCFEFDVDSQVVKSGDVCKWSVRYRSVIGTGRAFFIEKPADKRRALEIIVAQYGGDGSRIPQTAVEGTSVFAVGIDTLTGKQSAD